MSTVNAYSRLRHLVDALRPAHDPKRTFVVALTAYFDASGAPADSAILVVSGFVSSEKRWLTFERQWRKLLAQAEVEYFHMKEFAGSTGQFKTWKGEEDKRKTFLGKLIQIIIQNAMQSFAAGVVLRDWRDCNQNYLLDDEEFQPYSLCGWTCVDQVYRWCDSKKNCPRDEVMFIFEHGDTDQGHLINRVKTDFGVLIRTATKLQTGLEKPVVPLQAADFAAWQIMNVLRKNDAGELHGFREDFKLLFSKIPSEPYHRYFSMTPAPPAPAKVPIRPPSLIRFCAENNIPHRN